MDFLIILVFLAISIVHAMAENASIVPCGTKDPPAALVALAGSRQNLKPVSIETDRSLEVGSFTKS